MKSIDITEIDQAFKIQLPSYPSRSKTVNHAEKVINAYGSVVPDVAQIWMNL